MDTGGACMHAHQKLTFSRGNLESEVISDGGGNHLKVRKVKNQNLNLYISQSAVYPLPLMKLTFSSNSVSGFHTYFFFFLQKIVAMMLCPRGDFCPDVL